MKIKKPVSIITGTILIILMTACSKNKSQYVQPNTAPTSVNDVLQQKTDANVTQPQAVIITPSPVEKDLESQTATDNTQEYDVDLTVLSSTMVYSEVYNMMVTPEEYVGKTIKMSGSFATFINEEDGRYIFGCVITDATACCAQGIEFEPVRGFEDEASRPAESEVITVTGVFDTYIDGEMMYCTLRNAVVEE